MILRSFFAAAALLSLAPAVASAADQGEPTARQARGLGEAAAPEPVRDDAVLGTQLGFNDQRVEPTAEAKPAEQRQPPRRDRRQRATVDRRVSPKIAHADRLVFY